jgi:hypothetical protein
MALVTSPDQCLYGNCALNGDRLIQRLTPLGALIVIYEPKVNERKGKTDRVTLT